MKKILSALISLITICSTHAQMSGLLINENFTGYTNGDLNTASAGQGAWNASYSNNSTDFVQVAVSSPLVFPGYTSGTQYITVKQGGDYGAESGKFPDDPGKAFMNGIIPIHDDNTTFFLSFLVRVPSAAAISTTGDARANVALRTLNGGVFANFYIGVSGNGNQLKFGVNKNGSVGGIFAPGAYNFNTTYLIVVRYDVANGPATPDYDDKMFLWINPSLSAEPSISSAAVAIDNVQDFNFDGGMDAPAGSLQLFQEVNSATASFDAFRVAYAQGFATDEINSSAAWNALSPAGMPLPVSVSDFKGYVKDNSIELDWHVSYEYNVVGYEIERSNNGINFSYAGTVAAKSEGSEAFYKWNDVIPAAGNNYYRIKNIYKTGDAIYSQVVRISLKDRPASFVVYPNPALHTNMTIQATNMQPGDYTIKIFTAEGQLVFKELFTQASGSYNRALALPSAIPAGIYTIQLTGNKYKEVRSVIIQ